MDWLTNHAAAVQALAAASGAVLTLVLVATTIYYAFEAHASRKAAERSAAIAQQGHDLLKKQFDFLSGSGERRIREAVLRTKHTISYWKQFVPRDRWNPANIPDPEDLSGKELESIRDQARDLMQASVIDVDTAIAHLRNAKSEFDKIRRAPQMGSRTSTVNANPGSFLQAAEEALGDILAWLPDGNPRPLEPEEQW